MSQTLIKKMFYIYEFKQHGSYVISGTFPPTNVISAQTILRNIAVSSFRNFVCFQKKKNFRHNYETKDYIHGVKLIGTFGCETGLVKTSKSEPK